MDKSSKNRKVLWKFKYFITGAAVMAFVLSVYLIASHISGIKWQSSPVATVNGEAITVKEIMPKLSSHRSEIFDYFYEKYNAVPDKNFWENRFEGEVPAEMLKKEALDECVKIKVQQILAEKMGLIDDISYDKYLRDLKAENKRRKTAIKENQAIYGPEQYTESTYFSVLFTNMTNELKEKLEEQLVCSEDDINKYYEKGIKEGNFKKTATTKIEKITIAYSDNKNKDTAKKMAEEIHRKFSGGESFGNLSAYYGKDTSGKIEFDEQTLDSNSRSNDNKPATYEFTQKVMSLQPGQISDVFELDNAYYVVKCTERIEEGDYKLDEVKESITRVLKDQKYEQYIDDLVKKANVVINQSVYKNLKVE